MKDRIIQCAKCGGDIDPFREVTTYDKKLQVVHLKCPKKKPKDE